MAKTINLPTEFSKFTGLRYEKLTPGASGEEFRDNYLVPALESNDTVTIILDGNIGEYVPSFIEECFGGLIRVTKYSYKEFEKKVIIVSEDNPELIDDIKHYVKRETG